MIQCALESNKQKLLLYTACVLYGRTIIKKEKAIQIERNVPEQYL